MPLIPFGPYLPDLPARENQGLTVAFNVIPSAAGYRPLPSLAAANARLNGVCIGFASFISSSQNTVMYAADGTNLYRMAGSLSGWDSIYTWPTPGAVRCEFINFGGQIVATNYLDPMVVADVDSPNDAAVLDVDAPRARHLAVVKNFVMVGNLVTPDRGVQPDCLQWSAFENATNWPPPGSTEAVSLQSDFTQLLGDGGAVRAIRAGLLGADALVIQDRALVRLSYVGAPIIFSADVIEGGRGTASPGSVVQVGGVVYYLADDGFYVSDGASSKPIGAGRIDRTFFANLDESQIERISGTADPALKVVIWAYPARGNVGGNPSRVIIYNWETDNWSEGDIACEILCQSMSVGYTLDELDSIAASLDLLPGSLDDRLYAGNTRPILSAMDATHTLAYFSGPALEARLTTGEMQLMDGRNAIVQRVYPTIDTPDVTVNIGGRNSPTADVSYYGAWGLNEDGFCPTMVRAKYHRADVTIPVGATWTVAQGLDYVVVDGGNR